MHLHKKTPKLHPWTSWTCLFALTLEREVEILIDFWNVAGIFQSPSRLDFNQSLPCQHQLSLWWVPKQAGKLRCHSSSGPKCSTKAHFRHISGAYEVQGNRYNQKFSILAGTPREGLWLNTAGVSHCQQAQKPRSLYLASEIVTVYGFLILKKTQLKVDLHTSKFFSATPTFYLCSSFTRVMKKTVHSHMLLITSQLQGLHLIPTPENRKSWLTPKTYLPTVEISSEKNETTYLLPLQHCKGLPYIPWERRSEKDKGQLP